MSDIKQLAIKAMTTWSGCRDANGVIDDDVFNQARLEEVSLFNAISEIEAELAASQAREAELRKKLEAEIEAHGATITREAQLSLKLEAAEARIKASQEQEPVMRYLTFEDGADYWDSLGDYRPQSNSVVYALPPIPPELAELQRENAELTRKLAEQQAALNWWNDLVSESSGVAGFHLNGDIAEWGEFSIPDSGKEELRKLLEESKVPEETLIEIVTQAHMAGQFNQSQRDPSYYEARVYYGEKQLSIRAMLSATPQPKEPKQ